MNQTERKDPKRQPQTSRTTQREKYKAKDIGKRRKIQRYQDRVKQNRTFQDILNVSNPFS